MLDIKYIRENPELIKQVARNKNIKLDVDKLLKLDDQRKKLTQELEKIQATKNQTSKQIPTMSDSEKRTAFEEMKQIGNLQTELEEKLKPLKVEFDELMFMVPMYIHTDVPIGVDESGNVEIEKWGEPTKFTFPMKDHMNLGLDLDIIDNERAVKIGGTRSYITKGDGARLESAILKYAEDFISRKGFKLMFVPVLVNEQALYGTGHFPEGREDVYLMEKDNKYLVGTSEVSIASYYSNEILNEADLPIKLAGFSTCFRREAGSYGKDTSGLYRVHQFLKVEQFIICKNDEQTSMMMQKELMDNSKEFLQSLNLPYRVLNICSGDMGQGKYYMNDIETWMPSRNAYGETHSCSALLDFQARRLNLKYKDSYGKLQYCHTLNNTVVATPRILIPLLEINQTAEGSVNIPEVLQPYMDNQTSISK